MLAFGDDHDCGYVSARSRSGFELAASPSMRGRERERDALISFSCTTLYTVTALLVNVLSAQCDEWCGRRGGYIDYCDFCVTKHFEKSFII